MKAAAKLGILAATVLAVAVLMILALPLGLGSHPSGPERSTRMLLRALARAAGDYRRDCGAFPSEREGLNALLEKSDRSGRHGPYLEGEGVRRDPSDAWGTPLRYVLAKGTPRITSAGPDLRFGTADDLSSDD